MSMVFSTKINYAPNIVVKNTGSDPWAHMSMPKMLSLDPVLGLASDPKSQGTNRIYPQ